MMDLDLGVSDEMLGTFAPLLVYWIYSGFYVVLGLFAEDYRLHTKQDEDDKNLVSKFDVVKGVLLQQAVQAVVATLLFAVSFLRCKVFTAFLYSVGRRCDKYHMKLTHK